MKQHLNKDYGSSYNEVHTQEEPSRNKDMIEELIHPTSISSDIFGPSEKYVYKDFDPIPKIPLPAD